MKRFLFLLAVATALWAVPLHAGDNLRSEGERDSVTGDKAKLRSTESAGVHVPHVIVDSGTVTTGGGSITTAGSVSAYTVTTASGPALAANTSRLKATFVNTSTVWVYGAEGVAAVVGSGIALAPSGGSYGINSTNLYRGAVNFITATGTANLAVSEGQ